MLFTNNTMLCFKAQIASYLLLYAAIWIFFFFFDCELLAFKQIGYKGVCLLSSIMELDGTSLVVHRAQTKQKKEKTFEKICSNISFQKSWPGY